jgi:hypothetical protein
MGGFAVGTTGDHTRPAGMLAASYATGRPAAPELAISRTICITVRTARVISP